MFYMLRLLWGSITTHRGGARVGVARCFYLEGSEAADPVPRVKKTAPSTCGYLNPFSGTTVSCIHSVRSSSMTGLGEGCRTLQPLVAYLAGSSVHGCLLG